MSQTNSINSSGESLPSRLKAPPTNKLLDNLRTPDRMPSPQPTHLNVPGGNSNGNQQHRILHDQGTGYEAPKFEGRNDQMEKVMDLLEVKNFIPTEFVETETKWFYNELGIDDMYFQTETPEAVCSNIHSLYAAKVAAYARDDKEIEIRLDKEATDHAVYIDTSKPGISVVDGPRYEQRIDDKYLNSSCRKTSYRVESFRYNSLFPGNNQESMLRCYFVYQCHFDANLDDKDSETETNIDKVGDKRFLQKVTENTKQIYQQLLDAAVGRTGPVIEYFDIYGKEEKRLVIAYKQGTALGLFSALSDLYHYYGLTSSRKYVEQFANGYTIISVYLKPAPGVIYASKHTPIDSSIHQIVKELSLLYALPQNKFQNLFATGKLTLQETIYAHCVWVFCSHFINRLGNEYAALANILEKKNTAHMELLSKLKKRLRNETYTSDLILETITEYPELVHQCYLNFAASHYVRQNDGVDDFIPTLSYQRTKVENAMDDAKLREEIKYTCVTDAHTEILSMFSIFNEHCLKTNFYTPTKVSISFRFNPAFLPEVEYPQPLYGMFLVVSTEFRGFHLRFKEVARGGIRLVRSRNREAYISNVKTMFDENYNLAWTQQRKNKDIPEGGSKGVVLLEQRHQTKGQVAFEKYIDGLLDLLLKPESPGIKDPIVDLYGKSEILFMGPDEGTAGMVDWATEHARRRGAPFWKSFFTGKSPTLGGIPHDKYGMTTLSVREYVNGIYRKLSLDPSQVIKMQTGGPDGDLGSNEILHANEKYTTIIDGSGVLYDPNGINKQELLRLAHERVMISEFDTSKLSKDGYRVLVEENNIELPSGEIVHNGTAFRNTFHLRTDKHWEMFVPCGGRPEAIDLASAHKLIDKDGKCTIPYIVEGANLFLTQDAKLRLEEAGCILYKDASANKGGVTSSSLEVLASLAFDTSDFLTNMCVGADGKNPAFYDEYVAEIQEIIKRNARLEFEAIWKENEISGQPRSILSDKLSLSIVNMDEELQNSELWDDVKFRESVLADALPVTLLKKVGLKKIIERIPDTYLRAIFGSYLASRFVYECGLKSSPFAFFSFMQNRIHHMQDKEKLALSNGTSHAK